MKNIFIFGSGTGYSKMKHLLCEGLYELLGFIYNGWKT
ncbi:hypothetical protein CLH_0796 [Clostridium botulinum E3 str. Alaska E43]|nr:hypothetical protein CLH_0796 [Clostridium botulinum E3 str. Alaska E43]